MKVILQWLGSNKIFNLLILFSYFLLVALPHEWVGRLTVKIFKGLPRTQYNLLIASISLLFIVLIAIGLYKSWRDHFEKRRLAVYFGMTIIYMIMCFKILFVINIEAVHFPQYALFAILAFPLFKNSISTLVFSTFAGAADELYQYVILAPQRTNYFDFNDVVTDLIGVAMGLIILKIIGIPEIKYDWASWYKKKEFLFISSFSLVFFICCLAGLFSIYDNPGDPSFFTLVRKPEEFFWTIPPGPYVKFHVLRPLEGIILTVLLWIYYIGLNRFNSI